MSATPFPKTWIDQTAGLLPWLSAGLLILTQLAAAQIASREVLEVKIHYDDLEYSQAIAQGRRLLESPEALLPEEAAFLHQYVAFSYFSVGQLDSARSHFLSLLSLRPDIDFDRGETSPKIIEFFQELKTDYEMSAGSASKVAFTKYLLLQDRRPGAVWRSAVAPGWGQFYKNQKLKGALLGGAFWGSLIATGAAYLQEQDRKDAYTAATRPAEITARYESYNRWYKARRILTWTTVALWAITVGDANWSAAARPVASLNDTGNLLLGLSIGL